MTKPASHSVLSLFARARTISRLSVFLSTSASVEPRNFFERMMADKVFSPNDAEPAPMTVIFVGSVMSPVLQFQVSYIIWLDLTIESIIEKDTERLTLCPLLLLMSL